MILYIYADHLEQEITYTINIEVVFGRKEV